jgi:hypothetical protein
MGFMIYIYIASLSEISHLAHYNLLISKHVSLVSTNSKQIMPGGYIYIYILIRLKYTYLCQQLFFPSS